MLTIRLIGPPAIDRDGVAVRAPRGRKAWALLCYLVLAERPPSRRQVAELLFADAADPLGALRWTLAELRRTLGTTDILTGDPIVTGWGDPDEASDAQPLITSDLQLALAERADPAELLRADGELLAGVDVSASLEFESWLLVERHRVSAMIEARVREQAVSLLAAGQPAEAVPFAARAVARNPLEEGNHELLVRCLALAGDREAAKRQVAVCEDLMRRDLGIGVSAALHDAAESHSPTARVRPLSGRAAALSQLEAGRAAIVAGAVDAGVQCLRRAVSEAARAKDVGLQGRTLVALGGALVHAARGRDEEGAVVLHEAIAQAAAADDRATLVTAHRELGFIEVQAGRRRTADSWLAKAQALATTDEELAALLGVRGMNASDQGDYPEAFGYLSESIDRADRGSDRRQQAWSLALLARAHLLRAELSQATAAINRSLELVYEQRWLVFLPWPQSLQAEMQLRTGAVDEAADGLERAWELACQIGDPCWEGMAARGLGLLYAERGDHAGAADWLGEAMIRSRRVPDRYQWVHGHVLDASITTALAVDDVDRVAPLVDALGSLAARCDMRELIVRAQVHRARLGDPKALPAARLLATGVDNPVLDQLIANVDHAVRPPRTAAARTSARGGQR